MTVTPEYIGSNAVFKASLPDERSMIAGYVSIVRNPSRFEREGFFMEEGFWMEHLFVDPCRMNMRIGSGLVLRARDCAVSANAGRILVFVDPFARGFYEKTGADFVRMSSSSIPGREIPVFAYRFS